jgi:hypothetical protein
MSVNAIVAPLSKDWPSPVLPRGSQHDRCSSCGQVVLLLVPLTVKSGATVLCEGCAAGTPPRSLPVS